VTGGGTFASTVQDWDGEFGLTVTKVTKPVCENLIRMIGDRTTLRAITTTADKTTDLSIGDCADGENSLYLVYNKDMLAAEGGNSSRQNSSSGTSSTGGGSASSSTGPSCAINPTTDCLSGELVEGECACAPAEDGTECTSHTTNQCGLGYYCQFSPSNCGDSSRGNGVCTPVGSGTPLKDGAYLKGPGTDWWSAYSWCKGNGMDLVTGTIAGKALDSYYENYGNGPLYTYFGQDIYFWTGHDAGDSCLAWRVGARSAGEYVNSGRRYSNSYSALCE
jgi:hypothetical protein